MPPVQLDEFHQPDWLSATPTHGVSDGKQQTLFLKHRLQPSHQSDIWIPSLNGLGSSAIDLDDREALAGTQNWQSIKANVEAPKIKIRHVARDSIDCRGAFMTDANGNYLLRVVRPLGYSIPMDGPVGAMVTAQKRHGMRPAHIHFLISSPGFREMVTALYLADDVHLADDCVFGAHGDLVVAIVDNQAGCPIPNAQSIRFDFELSIESQADKLGGRVGGDPSKIAAPA